MMASFSSCREFPACSQIANMHFIHHISTTDTKPHERTLIIIDGENLFYSLREIGVKVRQVNWNHLFIELVGKGKLIEAQWHRPKYLHPHSLKKEVVLTQLLQEKYPNREKELMDQFIVKKLPTHIFRELNERLDQKRKWYRDQKKRFSEMGYYYQRLDKKHPKIELKLSGKFIIDPNTERWLGEKGIDVAVGAEMVQAACLDSCERIILMSGDADFAWAVQISQAHKKIVEVVEFAYQGKRSSLSSDLLTLANATRTVSFEQRRDSNKAIKKRRNMCYHTMCESVKEYISQAEMKQALKELGRYCEQMVAKRHQKHPLLFLSRFAHMKKDSVNGLITTEEFQVRKMCLTHDILDFLEEIKPK